jgi:hypothetical protein
MFLEEQMRKGSFSEAMVVLYVGTAGVAVLLAALFVPVEIGRPMVMGVTFPFMAIAVFGLNWLRWRQKNKGCLE